ncbi:MAG: hypothetical protein LBP62_03250 [Clostridiales bacterium]|jgi:hypothetical protein|nr:hypothetical protein [Clostridiales bacterium]
MTQFTKIIYSILISISLIGVIVSPTIAGMSILKSDIDNIAAVAGKDGVDGSDGADGLNGQDGKSAYQIALDNGFVGTEAEWLLSLQGSDGIDGIAGADGYTPYVGDNGNWFINGTDTGYRAANVSKRLALGEDYIIDKTMLEYMSFNVVFVDGSVPYDPETDNMTGTELAEYYGGSYIVLPENFRVSFFVEFEFEERSEPVIWSGVYDFHVSDTYFVITEQVADYIDGHYVEAIIGYYAFVLDTYIFSGNDTLLGFEIRIAGQRIEVTANPDAYLNLQVGAVEGLTLDFTLIDPSHTTSGGQYRIANVDLIVSAI